VTTDPRLLFVVPSDEEKKEGGKGSRGDRPVKGLCPIILRLWGEGKKRGK